MTQAERTWLLLCGDLADGLSPLTRSEVKLVQSVLKAFPDADLRTLGLSLQESDRIQRLLDRSEALDAYLRLGLEFDIRPITWVSPDYPERLRRLGDEAPPVLFFRGDPACLCGPFAAVVGSREIDVQAAAFARQAGTLAASEGFTLVSGNARGADQAAQQACLEAGGRILSVLPDSLRDHPPAEGEAFVTECGWHLPFSVPRALHRNLLIHALGTLTLAAQTGTSGGTWSGCTENLRRSLSPLYVRRDGSPGAEALMARGAVGVSVLTTLEGLLPDFMQLPL